MPSNLSDVQITESDITVTSGLYDTDDGIKLKVTGDAEPRIHLTPQGDIKRGDGTTAPVAGPSVYQTSFATTEFAAVATVNDISGAYYVIDAYESDGDAYVAFLVPDLAAVGSFTALLLGFTGGGIAGFSVSDGNGADATVLGPSPSPFPQNGMVIHAVNAGDGWVMAPSSTRTTAGAADFTPPNGSGWLTATNVQAALIQIFNHVD